MNGIQGVTKVTSESNSSNFRIIKANLEMKRKLDEDQTKQQTNFKDEN